MHMYMRHLYDIAEMYFSKNMDINFQDLIQIKNFTVYSSRLISNVYGKFMDTKFMQYSFVMINLVCMEHWRVINWGWNVFFLFVSKIENTGRGWVTVPLNKKPPFWVIIYFSF